MLKNKTHYKTKHYENATSFSRHNFEYRLCFEYNELKLFDYKFDAFFSLQNVIRKVKFVVQ